VANFYFEFLFDYQLLIYILIRRVVAVLQCSRLSDDYDSVEESDTEFEAVLRPTNDVIGDVTAADAAGDVMVVSAEQVISEIETMLEVRLVAVLWQCRRQKLTDKNNTRGNGDAIPSAIFVAAMLEVYGVAWSRPEHRQLRSPVEDEVFSAVYSVHRAHYGGTVR